MRRTLQELAELAADLIGALRDPAMLFVIALLCMLLLAQAVAAAWRSG